MKMSKGQRNGCQVKMIMSESTTGMAAAGLAAPQAGHLYRLDGATGTATDVSNVGDQQYQWTADHASLFSADFPDSNPYGVLVATDPKTDSIRTFVADAAHELRSPIASIRAQLEVALSTPTGGPQWSEVATDVLTDVERVGQLAEDMLLLARLDSGAGPRHVRLDAREVLGLAGPPAWVDGDPRALRRAFDNLVSNAHRHARSDVEVSSEVAGGWVVVTVDDDGPGIAPTDRERVFERWLRLDDARARDAGGSGLGLAIARSVAHAHGGDVVLEESLRGGVRARLRLPAQA
jgi:signal transduction histidine kinase